MRQIGIFLTVALLCVALVGCSDNFGSKGNENSNEQKRGGVLEETSDFELTVTANKTTVNVGETIEITATLKNFSGKDVFIELIEEATRYELEDILYIAINPEDLEWSWAFADISVLQKTKKTIGKDAVITRTVKHTFNETGNYNIDSLVAFYFEGENKRTKIESEPVSIKVK